MTDRRSDAARQYRPWYKTRAWQIVRRNQLREHPWCRMCLEAKARVLATVVDHTEPHRGDRARFFSGPFQSLCETHHNASKQREERAGYSTAVGEDGWPTDPRHPANR